MRGPRALLLARARRAGAPPGSDDRGSAVVEFVVLGVLLLVPAVYLVLCVARLQAAAFAAEGSAREAARVVAAPALQGGRAAPVGQEGRAADARAVVALALADQGFEPSSGRLEVRCSADPCSAPGSLVRTTVTVDVVLPGVPALIGGVVPTRVPVVATGSATGDRFAAS